VNLKVHVTMLLILDPLIALGLVDNRDEVSEIIKSEDDDGSGLLEFDEFLRIMKSGNSSSKGASEKTIKIYNFFKSLTTGKFNKSGKELIFRLFISGYRRTKILNAMMGDTPSK
jgi:hypothetical protein